MASSRATGGMTRAGEPRVKGCNAAQSAALGVRAFDPFLLGILRVKLGGLLLLPRRLDLLMAGLQSDGELAGASLAHVHA